MQTDQSARPYDAILVVTFGGPDGMDDVLPFLENVLRGRNVPPERMLAVAEHYAMFGGVSPINAQNIALTAALRCELDTHGVELPVYLGNRNWHPLLNDTMRRMADDGVRRSLAFVNSGFSSYSSCRQYHENIASARQVVGDGAPLIDKLRVFFNHPGFIAAMADRLREALDAFDTRQRANAHIVFTAHSIPTSMAQTCGYESQLREACRLVMCEIGDRPWSLAYQSRSGPPSQPWLEPDVCVFLRDFHEGETSRHVVLAPIGFMSDHVEVVYDLDTEAKQVCDELAINMVRAGTVGTHPRYVAMIRDLIEERVRMMPSRAVVGEMPAAPDICPADCCPPLPRSALQLSADVTDNV